VDRRRFLLTSLAGALAVPLAAEAQQVGKIYRIGYLAAVYAPRPDMSTRAWQAFLVGLRELGYVEGHNLVLEPRFAEGDVERLPRLAAELVRLKPDVIVTLGTPATLARPRRLNSA
jgi:putative ABC transport system substrate-binding protein